MELVKGERKETTEQVPPAGLCIALAQLRPLLVHPDPKLKCLWSYKVCNSWEGVPAWKSLLSKCMVEKRTGWVNDFFPCFNYGRWGIGDKWVVQCQSGEAGIWTRSPIARGHGFLVHHHLLFLNGYLLTDSELLKTLTGVRGKTFNSLSGD